MEGASSLRPGQATMIEGMDSPEGDGRVSALIKEGASARGLSPSPTPYPQRVRRKSRKCGICPQDEEEAGFSLGLGQSLDGHCRPVQSASLESSAGPQRLISSKDTGPEDPGGSWVEPAPEAAFECMLFSKNMAQAGSLDHLFGFPELFGDESLSLITQDPPQSPALYPGVLSEGSTEQQEAQPVFVVGSSGSPPDPEGPQVNAQPVSRLELGQGFAAPAEPLGGPSGASLGQRRPRHVNKWQQTGPVSCAQKQHTVNSSQDQPEEVIQRGCPRVEKMRVPCGVKLVYYICSGPGIQLLGAFSNSQPGRQLETLEDLVKVSSAKRQRRPMTSHPANCQCDLMETEKPLQERTEDPGEQESMLLDVGVRSTVVHAMQEVLWTRVQEFPDLLLREEEVAGIAEGIEAALFRLTQDTNLRYKTKYRSLLFNLRDPRNSDLFLKVAHCDVSPHDLVQMSSIQLAPKELSCWRDQEKRRGLDILEQQQKELSRLPTSKLTHKGEVEIPRDSDQMLTLEDLMEPMVPQEYSPQALTTPLEDTTDQHQHHIWDSNCHICKDWKSSAELPGLSRAIMNKEEDVIWKAPSPAPVSSPEMLTAGETPSKEPQDRLQMPAGPKNVPPSPPPWEGSLDMFSIKRFRVKAQLVSGHSCQLVQALPEVIRSAGCLRPKDLWDLLDLMCPARAKDICVVRLCPHGSRDIQNYRMLYSYLNNKQRHCLVIVQHVKVVLLPLPAFQPLPARLRPLGGPGGPVFPGIGHGQHLHRASCFHQDLLQHLKVLVTMSHQFQASLWPPGQQPLLPSSAVSSVPDPPGPISDPSLGPRDGGGSECL
ncbi:SPOC domain-containing protein 1 isoform X2 [Peromyscus californicus insignis]|uniref:SPOC domain-containing protein 1 isoform X2 n=1 Tax=Peromyscus californicus insignis TaxID=564181 RepID=UPI0022A7ACF0|nr:SPOC domain-containing protein 1 isoform X2 [Peromyscus californicus insignis]